MGISRAKILIVEDDHDTQLFLDLFLGRSFDLEMCRSNQTFYEKIKAFKFDLILWDIAAKGRKNDLQIIREIKNSGEHKDIPVICLSAHVLEKDKNNAIEAGADVFLPKPVSNDLLLESIIKLLTKRN